MARNDDEFWKALEELRADVATLKARPCLTEDQKRAQLILLRIVDAAIKVLWLTNGAVKNLGVPLGILIGVYAYGLDILEWAVGYLKGLQK